ncbi:YkgJ family cysteine cluster protein [Escherichia albertii]|uniref:YkgJ family cysteine cluster protein n=1 Tax=Escherichia albertii TaxID=208962 RepID=A0A7Z7YNS9_ESCAL|nr:YkgJ family cysteine cluster protein [Escherichia albertii]
MSNLNPCMACGACCAFFHVSFYQSKTNDTGVVISPRLMPV